VSIFQYDLLGKGLSAIVEFALDIIFTVDINIRSDKNGIVNDICDRYRVGYENKNIDKEAILNNVERIILKLKKRSGIQIAKGVPGTGGIIWRFVTIDTILWFIIVVSTNLRILKFH